MTIKSQEKPVETLDKKRSIKPRKKPHEDNIIIVFSARVEKLEDFIKRYKD